MQAKARADGADILKFHEDTRKELDIYYHRLSRIRNGFSKKRVEISVIPHHVIAMNDLIAKYKMAMAHHAQAVSIITHRKGQNISGMTVSSASSYSAEPPIFMTAIHKESSLARQVSLGDRLAMNLLSQSDLRLAARFSGATGIKGAERFQKGDWILDENAPRLKDALASFSGELFSLIPQASHALLLVLIDEIHTHPGKPLIYYDRHYHKPQFNDPLTPPQKPKRSSR